MLKKLTVHIPKHRNSKYTIPSRTTNIAMYYHTFSPTSSKTFSKHAFFHAFSWYFLLSCTVCGFRVLILAYCVYMYSCLCYVCNGHAFNKSLACLTYLSIHVPVSSDCSLLRRPAIPMVPKVRLGLGSGPSETRAFRIVAA